MSESGFVHQAGTALPQVLIYSKYVGQYLSIPLPEAFPPVDNDNDDPSTPSRITNAVYVFKGRYDDGLIMYEYTGVSRVS